MKKVRLKENHPTFEKFTKLCECAEELGISLWFGGGNCYIKDASNPKYTFQVKDIEDTRDVTFSVTSFPYEMEFKIEYEKDSE